MKMNHYLNLIYISFIVKGECQLTCNKTIPQIDEIIKILGKEDEIKNTYNQNVKNILNTPQYEDLVKDLKESINVVKDTSSFCFPFYDYTSSSIKAVQEVGFKVAFIGGERKATRNDNKYKIPRYPIHDYDTLSSFKSMVN